MVPNNARKHYAYKLVWITARGETLPAQYSNCFPRLMKSAKAASADKRKGLTGTLFARTVDGKWKAYAHVRDGNVYAGAFPR